MYDHLYYSILEEDCRQFVSYYIHLHDLRASMLDFEFFLNFWLRVVRLIHVTLHFMFITNPTDIEIVEILTLQSLFGSFILTYYLWFLFNNFILSLSRENRTTPISSWQIKASFLKFIKYSPVKLTVVTLLLFVTVDGIMLDHSTCSSAFKESQGLP